MAVAAGAGRPPPVASSGTRQRCKVHGCLLADADWTGHHYAQPVCLECLRARPHAADCPVDALMRKAETLWNHAVIGRRSLYWNSERALSWPEFQRYFGRLVVCRCPQRQVALNGHLNLPTHPAPVFELHYGAKASAPVYGELTNRLRVMLVNITGEVRWLDADLETLAHQLARSTIGVLKRLRGFELFDSRSARKRQQTHAIARPVQTAK